MKDKRFLIPHFSENDNSSDEYRESLKQYLIEIKNSNHWTAMSPDHALYLDGARQMLKEIIELVSKP